MIKGIKFLIKTSIVICTIIGVLCLMLDGTDGLNEITGPCAAYGFIGAFIWMICKPSKHRSQEEIIRSAREKGIRSGVYYSKETLRNAIARNNQNEEIRAMKRQMEENNFRMKELAKERDFYEAEAWRNRRR